MNVHQKSADKRVTLDESDSLNADSARNCPSALDAGGDEHTGTATGDVDSANLGQGDEGGGSPEGGLDSCPSLAQKDLNSGNANAEEGGGKDVAGSGDNAAKTAEAVGSTPNKLLEPFMLPSSSRLNPLVGSYLEKLSPTALKGFQRRFFRLNITDNALLYWREEPTFKDQQPQGSINLSSVIAIHIEDALNFVIRTHGRDYCLRASSPGDKDIWLESVCIVVNSVARIETLREASAQHDFARQLIENSGSIQNYLSEALKTQKVVRWAKEDSIPLTFSLRGKKHFLSVKNIQDPLSKLWFDSTFGFKYYNNSGSAQGVRGTGVCPESGKRGFIPRSSSFCTSSFSSLINTSQCRSEDFIGYSCLGLNKISRKKSPPYFYGTFRGKGVRINKISNTDFMGLESPLAPTPISLVTPTPVTLGGESGGSDLTNGNNTPRVARFSLPCNSSVLNNNIPFLMENSQQFEWSNLFQSAVRVRSHLDNVLFGTVYVEIGPLISSSEGAGSTGAAHSGQFTSNASFFSIGSSSNNPSGPDADLAGGTNNQAGSDPTSGDGTTEDPSNGGGVLDGGGSGSGDASGGDNGNAVTDGTGNVENSANSGGVDGGGDEAVGSSGFAADSGASAGYQLCSLVSLQKYFAFLISSRPIANNEAFFPLPNNISLKPFGGTDAKGCNSGSCSNIRFGAGGTPSSGPSGNDPHSSGSSVLPFNIQLDCLYLFPPEYDDSYPCYVIELDNIQLSSKIREVQTGFQFKLQVPLENILTYIEESGGSGVSARSRDSDPNAEGNSVFLSPNFLGNRRGIQSVGGESREVASAGGGSGETGRSVMQREPDDHQRPSQEMEDTCRGRADPDTPRSETSGLDLVQEKKQRRFQQVTLLEHFVYRQRGGKASVCREVPLQVQQDQHQHAGGSSSAVSANSHSGDKVSVRIVSVFGPDAEIWREALIASCRARHAAKEERMRTLNDEVRAFDSVPRSLMQENASRLFYKTLYYILNGGGGGEGVNDESLGRIASIIDSKRSGTGSVFGIKGLEFKCSCGGGSLTVIGGCSFCSTCLERKLISHISSCFVTVPISRILQGLSVFNSTVRDLRQASIRILSSPRIDVLRFVHEKYLLPVLSVIYECYNTRVEFIREYEILEILDFLVEMRSEYESCGIFDSSFKYMIICYTRLYTRRVIRPYLRQVFRQVYETCHFGKTYRDKETGNLHIALVSEVFGTIYSLASFFCSLKLYNLSFQVRNAVFIIIQQAIMQFQMVLRDAVLYNLCKVTDSDTDSLRFFFRPTPPASLESRERYLSDYLTALGDELYAEGGSHSPADFADLGLDYSNIVITTEVICGLLNGTEQFIYKCDELDLLLERWSPFTVLRFEQEFVKEGHYFNGYLFGTSSFCNDSDENCVSHGGGEDAENSLANEGVGGDEDSLLENEAIADASGPCDDMGTGHADDAASGANRNRRSDINSGGVGASDPGQPNRNNTQSIDVDLSGVSSGANGVNGEVGTSAPCAASGDCISKGKAGGGVPAISDSGGGEQHVVPSPQTQTLVSAAAPVGSGGNSNSSILENIGACESHFINSVSEECLGDLDMFIPRNLRNETRRFILLFHISQMFLTVKTCREWGKKLQEYFVSALKEKYRESSGPNGGVATDGGEVPGLSAPNDAEKPAASPCGRSRGTDQSCTAGEDDRSAENDECKDGGRRGGASGWMAHFLSLDMSNLLKDHLRPQLRILKISLKKRLFNMVSRLVLEYTVRTYIESLLLFAMYYSASSEHHESCASGNSKLIAAKLLEDWDVFGHFFQDCMSEEEVRECLIILADLHDMLTSQKITLCEKCHEFQDKYKIFDFYNLMSMVTTLRCESRDCCNPGRLLSSDIHNSVGDANTVVNVGSHQSLDLEKMHETGDSFTADSRGHSHPLLLVSAVGNVFPSSGGSGLGTSSRSHTSIDWTRESDYSWTRQMNILRSVGALISQGGSATTLAGTHGQQQQHIHHNHNYYVPSEVGANTSGSSVSSGTADLHSGPVSVSNSGVLASMNIVSSNRCRRISSFNLDEIRSYLLVDHANAPAAWISHASGPDESSSGSAAPGPGNAAAMIPESSSINPSSSLKRSFSLEFLSQLNGDETCEKGIVASFLTGKMLIYSPIYISTKTGGTSVHNLSIGLEGGSGSETGAGLSRQSSDFVLNKMLEKDEEWWSGVYNYYSQVYVPSNLFGLAPSSGLSFRSSGTSHVPEDSDVSVAIKYRRDTHPSKIITGTVFGRYMTNYFCYLRPPVTERSAFELILPQQDSSGGVQSQRCGSNVNSFITAIGNYNPRIYFGPVRYRYSRSSLARNEWRSGFLFIEDLAVLIYDSIYRIGILDMFTIRPSPQGKVTRICIDPQDLTRTGFILFWGDRDIEANGTTVTGNNSGTCIGSASGGGFGSSSGSLVACQSSAAPAASGSSVVSNTAGSADLGGAGGTGNNGSFETRPTPQNSSNSNIFVDSKSFSVYFKAPTPKLAGIWVSEIDDLIHKSRCIWGRNLSESLAKRRLCQYLNPFVVPDH